MTKICPKCHHQRNANDDPAIPDWQCPACGVAYAKVAPVESDVVKKIRENMRQHQQAKQPPADFTANKQPSPAPSRPQPASKPTPSEHIEPDVRDVLLANMAADKYKTNHLLHCVLSVVTLGFWLLIWIIATVSDTIERNKIYRQYNLPTEQNQLGMLLSVFFLLILYSWVSGIATKTTTPEKPKETPVAIADSHSDIAASEARRIENDRREKAAAISPTFTVRAQDMQDDYALNTLQGDRKYKGKWFNVILTIHSINTDFTGQPYIVAETNHRLLGPQFSFADGQTEQLLNLQPGYNIQITCLGSGDIAKTPTAKQCRF